jgi:Fe-S-cluster containining protein
MSGVRRFACTQCGKCCNRSPEIELSEAATLADVFVFRLMFRLYQLPHAPKRNASGNPETFYQKKRLLAAHAARTNRSKVMRDGKAVECTNYLMISALAADTAPGACTALSLGRCSIHARRPLGCRSVPIHYSRAEGLAASDFDSFIATPGFRCDTSDEAPPFLQGGRIVDSGTLQARADALALAERDRPWKEEIVRQMRKSRSGDDRLPTFRDLEANAHLAVMTTSMRVGWAIAANAGILRRQVYWSLIEQQLAAIERELARNGRGSADSDTLREMRIEYRRALSAGGELKAPAAT